MKEIQKQIDFEKKETIKHRRATKLEMQAELKASSDNLAHYKYEFQRINGTLNFMNSHIQQLCQDSMLMHMLQE